MCDCERGHNGLGIVGRECDCQDDGYEPPFEPSPPPTAPCADEVEVVALAMWSEDWPRNPWEDASEYEKQTLVRRATIALAALSQLRQAERDAAWRDGAEAMRKTLCEIAERYRLPRNALGDMRAQRAPPPPAQGGQ